MSKFFHLRAFFAKKTRLWNWSGSLVLLAPLFLFSPRPAIAEAIQFKAAYHKDHHQEIKTQDGQQAIQFDSFVAMDWKVLAQEHFKAYPMTVDQISTTQLKALQRISFFGYASVPFAAEAPATITQQKMIFLSHDGSREVVVKELKGIVRYKFDRNQKRIISINYFGYVLAAPKLNNIHSGGFVALLQYDQKLVRERLVNLEPETLAQINPYQKLKVKRQTQYEFHNIKESYLVLEYETDGNCEYGCCEHRYLLFEHQERGKPFKQLAGCEYECDI